MVGGVGWVKVMASLVKSRAASGKKLKF